jgi:hypothetical protein
MKIFNCAWNVKSVNQTILEKRNIGILFLKGSIFFAAHRGLCASKISKILPESKWLVNVLIFNVYLNFWRNTNYLKNYRFIYCAAHRCLCVCVSFKIYVILNNIVSSTQKNSLSVEKRKELKYENSLKFKITLKLHP